MLLQATSVHETTGEREPHCRAAGVLVLLATITAAFMPAAARAQDTLSLAGRRVVVWGPAASGPQPIVLFSHGFGGCATQSKFLTAGLAARGYYVFAVDHRDANCRRRNRAQPLRPFRDPAGWSDATYRDRGDDLRAVLAALRADRAFQGRLDFGRIGLVGHSLGGYTVLGLGGAWASWKLPGVGAVVALSPYAQPYVVHQTLGGLAAPVMYQGGTLDFGITPAVQRQDGAYDLSAQPKYFVDFAGIGHFGWTDLNANAHAVILDYTAAFLDHYLRGQPAAPLLTQRAAGVSALRWDSELGHGRVGSGDIFPSPLRRRPGLPRP